MTFMRSGTATGWMQYGPGAGAVSSSFGRAAMTGIDCANRSAQDKPASTAFLTVPIMRAKTRSYAPRLLRFGLDFVTSNTSLAVWDGDRSDVLPLDPLAGVRISQS